MLFLIEVFYKQSAFLDSLHSCKILMFLFFSFVKLKNVGYEVFNVTTQVVVRSFLMSDSVHHEENRIHSVIFKVIYL
jgi:hypothetical protein